MLHHLFFVVFHPFYPFLLISLAFFYLFLLLDHHSFFLILYHPSLFCILSYSGSSFLVLLSPFVPLVNFFFGLYHLSLSLVILCYPLPSGFCPSCPFLSFGLPAQGLALEEEGMGVKEEARAVLVQCPSPASGAG